MMQEEVTLNNILHDKLHKQTVCHPDGRELFVVSSNLGNTKQTTSVTTLQGNREVVNMRADFWGTVGATFLGIATFHSPDEMQNFLPGEWTREDFFVQIAPGVDTAFVVVMIVVYKKMNTTFTGNFYIPNVSEGAGDRVLSMEVPMETYLIQVS